MSNDRLPTAFLSLLLFDSSLGRGSAIAPRASGISRRRRVVRRVIRFRFDIPPYASQSHVGPLAFSSWWISGILLGRLTVVPIILDKGKHDSANQEQPHLR